MTEEEFWAVIENCHAQSGGIFANQVELQRERLLALTLEELLSFNERWEDAFEKAFTWPVWDAAYLLCNGCGDDSFMDFRAWLIGQGRAVFDRVISDPDSLADLVGLAGDADGADAERFGGLVDEVHEQMTGTCDLPPSRSAGPGKTEPSGESVNVDDEQIACSHFPRLAEHYYSERARRYG